MLLPKFFFSSFASHYLFFLSLVITHPPIIFIFACTSHHLTSLISLCDTTWVIFSLLPPITHSHPHCFHHTFTYHSYSCTFHISLPSDFSSNSLSYKLGSYSRYCHPLLFLSFTLFITYPLYLSLYLSSDLTYRLRLLVLVLLPAFFFSLLRYYFSLSLISSPLYLTYLSLHLLCILFL